MANILTDTDFEAKTAEGVTCRMQSPIVEELAEELEGQVNVYKMNVDDEPKTAQGFGIMSIPTLLVKKDGEVVEKLVGFHDKARLQEVLNRHI